MSANTSITTDMSFSNCSMSRNVASCAHKPTNPQFIRCCVTQLTQLLPESPFQSKTRPSTETVSADHHRLLNNNRGGQPLTPDCVTNCCSCCCCCCCCCISPGRQLSPRPDIRATTFAVSFSRSRDFFADTVYEVKAAQWSGALQQWSDTRPRVAAVEQYRAL